MNDDSRFESPSAGPRSLSRAEIWMPSRPVNRAVVFFLGLMLTLGICATAPVVGASQARVASPTATGSSLVNQYFELLEKRDVSGLERFLSPAFQVVRADGSTSRKATYLSNFPVVKSFTITGVVATQSNGTLVVRYLVTATGVANGKPYTPGPAPRLSVFDWNRTRWQLAAHANFNPLSAQSTPGAVARHREVKAQVAGSRGIPQSGR